MAGWSEEKRDRVESAFYDFLGRCYVNSRDHGRICLGEHLFDGQIEFISAVFDALEDDIHKIYVLKSRQLGISTICRALIVFFMGTIRGLKGALVFDTAPNREEARAELVSMITDLPKSLRFPRIVGSGRGNRDRMELEGGTTILFKSAGVRKSTSSGTLGRSVGLSVAHLSEICSYDNDEGLEAFENSLSDVNPDRLYIYESTARGFNQWKLMWEDARDDPAHCRCLFLGWWSKNSQKIERDHPDFEIYGRYPPTEKEGIKIEAVWQQYARRISQEQLAWLRRKMDPRQLENAVNPKFENNQNRIQEQPWTEEEAFQQTGSVFFASENLTEISNKYVSKNFQTYMYAVGAEFDKMRIFKADNVRSVELKVWEEPDSEGVYVIGVDPAFGHHEDNDRSSIQVLRCYADGIDQVAEYAWPLIGTRQFAWAIASLLGWYSVGNADVRYILELNGPGGAVFDELKQLKHQIESGYRYEELAESGLRNIFRNVKAYMYQRVDTIGPGSNWHFKTQLNTKPLIMERMRDAVSTDKFHIRSAALIDEMRSIVRKGDKIEAPPSSGENHIRDDRVVAAALAVYYWESRIRKNLMTSKRTRETEAAKKRLSIQDQVFLFQQNQLQAFFGGQQRQRIEKQRLMQRNAWRYGRTT
jgi:hypothetical protein